MKRWFFGITAAALLAVACGLLLGPVSHAGGGKTDRSKADRDKLNAAIKSKGKIQGGANYWTLMEGMRGGKKRTVAAVPFNVKAGGLKGDKAGLAASGRSSFTVVGGEGLPKGFGVGFTWDRGDPEALLVMFINAADPFGVSIDGLKAGDQLHVMSATGLASYSEDKGNPTASSIVGLVAKGANIAL